MRNCLLAVLASSSALVAQPTATHPGDLIGLSFTGQIVFFDSSTADGTQVGQTILTGINAAARQGRNIRFVNRVGTVIAPTFDLRTMEPLQAINSLTASNVGFDPRGLAEHPSDPDKLLAVVNGAGINGIDVLVEYDLATNVVTTIGPTGLTGIQALETLGNVVYAWDINVGLVLLSLVTGAAVDPFPQVGTQGADIQFLVAHTDGRLLGGRSILHEVDPTTGLVQMIAPIAGGGFDVRGAAERVGIGEPFGNGCGSAGGGQAQMLVTPVPTEGQPFFSQSSLHSPGSIGLRIVGFDDRLWGAAPLPLDLDGLLGTVGCTLNVRPDVLDVGVTGPTGRLTFTFTLPPGSGNAFFFVQHVALDAAPGGLSFSRGGHVRIQP